MEQYNLDEVKNKSAKLWQLYNHDLDGLAKLRRQLNGLKVVLIDWSKGGKLDIETVGDFVVIFAVLYAKMYDNSYNVSDAPRQAYFEKFVPLDKEYVVESPTPKSIHELFLREETVGTFLMHFEVLEKEIGRWLSNKPISFAEVFSYLDIFTQLYELLALGKNSSQIGSIQVGNGLDGLILERK